MTPVTSNTPNHPRMNQATGYLLLFICPLADIAQHTCPRSREWIKKGKWCDVKGERQDARDFCHALGLDVDSHFFDCHVPHTSSLFLLMCHKDQFLDGVSCHSSGGTPIAPTASPGALRRLVPAKQLWAVRGQVETALQHLL